MISAIILIAAAKIMSKRIHAQASGSMDLAFVIALLRERSLSLRSIALNNGHAPRTLSNALYRDHPKTEKLIAAALCKTASESWPKRIATRRARPMGRPRA
jgi:lambda repressor-like predicted transcriptional regulator